MIQKKRWKVMTIHVIKGFRSTRLSWYILLLLNRLIKRIQITAIFTDHVHCNIFSRVCLSVHREPSSQTWKEEVIPVPDGHGIGDIPGTNYHGIGDPQLKVSLDELPLSFEHILRCVFEKTTTHFNVCSVVCCKARK